MISEFVLEQARRSSVGSAKCMVTRLRALLRFLHVEGEIERDLAGAVLRDSLKEAKPDEAAELLTRYVR